MEEKKEMHYLVGERIFRSEAEAQFFAKAVYLATGIKKAVVPTYRPVTEEGENNEQNDDVQ